MLAVFLGRAGGRRGRGVALDPSQRRTGTTAAHGTRPPLVARVLGGQPAAAARGARRPPGPRRRPRPHRGAGAHHRGGGRRWRWRRSRPRSPSAASLDHLLDTPRLYGWSWDAQIGGRGFPDFGTAVTAGTGREPRGRGLRERHHRRDRSQRRARRGLRGERTRAPDGAGAARRARAEERERDRARHPDPPFRGRASSATRSACSSATSRGSFRVVGRAVFPDVGDIGQLGRGAYVTFGAVDGVGGRPPRTTSCWCSSRPARRPRRRGVASLTRTHWRRSRSHRPALPARPGQLRPRRRTAARGRGDPRRHGGRGARLHVAGRDQTAPSATSRSSRPRIPPTRRRPHRDRPGRDPGRGGAAHRAAARDRGSGRVRVARSSPTRRASRRCRRSVLARWCSSGWRCSSPPSSSRSCPPASRHGPRPPARCAPNRRDEARFRAGP